MIINNGKCQDICVFDEDDKVESTSPSALFWPDAGSFSSQECGRLRARKATKAEKKLDIVIFHFVPYQLGKVKEVHNFNNKIVY